MCVCALNKIRHDQSRWMIQDQAQSLLGGGSVWPKAPQPAKCVCLPQGLALGVRSAPFTLVQNISERNSGVTQNDAHFLDCVMIINNCPELAQSVSGEH